MHKAGVKLAAIVASLLLAALVIAGLWWQQGTSETAVTVPAAYVPNADCLSCHAEQAAQWASSHHAQAMAPATAATVKGDFSGKTFRDAGVTSRFFRKGERFLVNTEGPDGKLADFEMAYTFGVAPLQQYLIALPGGRLQAFQIAWDDQKKRWFPLRTEEKTPPGDVLHWTGRYQTANTMCIVCHTTAYEKNYDAAKDTFDSRWREPNVSCQACHGPGSEHVAWAQKPVAQRAQSADSSSMGLAVNTRSADRQKLLDVCTPCHSRRSELSAQGVPGEPLLDHYLPSVLREDLYHADGQQLDEVYVDGSFRQSKMFMKGVTCTDCHNPHTGKLRQAGNAVCMQCHAPSANANAKFPTAVGDFDTPSHHFHQPGSAGAQCTACHMPGKVYMGIQARPDHSLRVPRPDLSAKTGSPNACNQCHTKKTAAWAADAVARWYGARRRQETHYGESIADHRAGKSAAAEALVALAAKPEVNPIFRATALDALRNDSLTGLPVRINALTDAADEVRVAAADGLQGLPPARRMEVLGPRLSDQVRAVRLAAVRSLSDIPRNMFEPALQVQLDAVLAEYMEVQKLSLDMPGSHLNLAVVYQNTAQWEMAEKHYLDAVKLDPDFSQARLNLAQLYAIQRRMAEAQKVLAQGLFRVPGIGELQYSLGLLLAQDGKLPEAVAALEKAAKLLPQRGRVQYNLGLAYQQSGKFALALKALLASVQRDPEDADAVYALAAHHFHAGQFAKAREWAGRLQKMRPDDRRTADLQRALQSL